MTGFSFTEEVSSFRREFTHEFLFDLIPARIWYIDKKGIILRINKAVEDYLNLRKEQVIGKSVFDVLPRDEALKFYARNLEVINKNIELKNKIHFVEKNGEKHWFKSDRIPFKNDSGEIKGVIVFIIDVSNQLKEKEKLRENEKKFRSLIDDANEGILIVNKEGKHLYANKRAAIITGHSLKELLELNNSELIHSKDLDKVFNRLKKRINGLYAPATYEVTLVKKNKENVLVEFSASKIFWGEEPASAVFFRNISDRKKTEEKLKQSERIYKKLIDSSSNAVIIHSNNVIVFANKAALKMSGCEKFNALTGKSIFDFVHPKYHELVTKRINDSLVKKNELEEVFEELIDLNGVKRKVLVSSIPIIFEEKQSILTIIKLLN